MAIAQYLPSKAFVKKLVFLIIVLALCFGIAQLFSFISKRQQAKEQQAVVTEAAKAEPILLRDVANLDANNNAVADWIEHLYGDTIPTQTNPGETENINETEQLARDIFATATATGQVAPLSNEGVASIAEQVADNIAKTQTGEIFTEDEIKIVPNGTKNEQTYTTSIKKILDTQYPLDIDNSLAILKDALDSADASKLDALDPISTRYKNLIAAFKALPVPSKYVEDHLAFLNLLGKCRGQIETMKNAFTNPVLAMATFINYPETLDELVGFISPFTNKIPYIRLIPTE
jgi:hypothetical protein